MPLRQNEAVSTSRRDLWNERYSGPDRVWSAEPNRDVADIIATLQEGGVSPGRALDLGAGEGRHAIWLASQGWQVTAVDYAEVGLARGEREAAERGVEDQLRWIAADVTQWSPGGESYDLVLCAFLHLPEDVFSRAREWLTPGGHLVIIGHALRNLTDGHGGPQDPALLHTTDQLRVKATGLDITRCDEVTRTTASGERAIDVVLVARRPAESAQTRD